MNQAQFFRTVERSLRPTFSECFTAETRKTRNIVLIVSGVLILQAVGAIVVTGTDLKLLAWLRVTFSADNSLRWTLVAICSFFLLLLLTRSYTEWQLWRLKHKAAVQDFLDVVNATADRQNALFVKYLEGLIRASRAEEQEAIQLLEATKADPSNTERQQLEKALRDANVSIKRASWSVKGRFWIEAIFPIAFGFTSIVFALLVR